jgi:4-hydroxy-4-methyl-2-oxoglutarate aldolase
MIRVNPCAHPVDAEALRILSSIDTNEIGHKRFWGVMSPTLRPVISGRRMAGTAVTVAIPAFDSALIPYVLSMVRPGDVLVIDRLGDERHSCLGGTVTLAAKVAGVAGIVVDGYATDFDEIRENGVPVWCKGPAALTTKLLGVGGAINVPVCCGGVAVNPGDAIIADDVGLCVLRPDEIEDVILAFRSKSVRDREERLIRGEKLADLNGCQQTIDARLAEQEKLRRDLLGMNK